MAASSWPILFWRSALSLESGTSALEVAPTGIVFDAWLMADFLEVLVGGILEDAMENDLS